MPEYFASSIPLFEESIRASGVAKAFSKGATSNEIAINMLKQKLNHRLIAQATGLSTEQITKLENK